MVVKMDVPAKAKKRNGIISFHFRLMPLIRFHEGKIFPILYGTFMYFISLRIFFCLSLTYGVG